MNVFDHRARAAVKEAQVSRRGGEHHFVTVAHVHGVHDPHVASPPLPQGVLVLPVGHAERFEAEVGVPDADAARLEEEGRCDMSSPKSVAMEFRWVVFPNLKFFLKLR